MEHQQTAHRIGDVSVQNNATRQMILWKCEPPFKTHEYVVSVYLDPWMLDEGKTVLMGANSDGRVKDCDYELAKAEGTTDPQRVFEQIGYTVG